jgi:hypothetical protein
MRMTNVRTRKISSTEKVLLSSSCASFEADLGGLVGVEGDSASAFFLWRTSDIADVWRR